MSKVAFNGKRENNLWVTHVHHMIVQSSEGSLETE